MEREDEFDIHPIEEIHKRRLDLEDEVVDVLSVDPGKGHVGDDGFQMPVMLGMDISDEEEDIVAIGPGTMRRRSPGASRNKANGAGAGDSGDEKPGSRGLTINGTTRTSNQVRRR